MARDKLNINLLIAGEPFSLTIPFEQEEVVRKAAELINSDWLKLSARFHSETPLRVMIFIAQAYARSYLTQMEVNSDAHALLSDLEEEFDRLLTSELNAAQEPSQS